MTHRPTAIDDTKLGVATIVTALVDTLNETDPTFKRRFLERLGQAGYSRKNGRRPSELDEIELLNWTTEFITGFSGISGQGEPLYTGD